MPLIMDHPKKKPTTLKPTAKAVANPKAVLPQSPAKWLDRTEIVIHLDGKTPTVQVKEQSSVIATVLRLSFEIGKVKMACDGQYSPMAIGGLEKIAADALVAAADELKYDGEDDIADCLEHKEELDTYLTPMRNCVRLLTFTSSILFANWCFLVRATSYKGPYKYQTGRFTHRSASFWCHQESSGQTQLIAGGYQLHIPFENPCEQPYYLFYSLSHIFCGCIGRPGRTIQWFVPVRQSYNCHCHSFLSEQVSQSKDHHCVIILFICQCSTARTWGNWCHGCASCYRGAWSSYFVVRILITILCRYMLFSPTSNVIRVKTSVAVTGIQCTRTIWRSLTNYDRPNGTIITPWCIICSRMRRSFQSLPQFACTLTDTFVDQGKTPSCWCHHFARCCYQTRQVG